MKPDWDKLTSEFEGHPSILIVDVDCTAEGKSKCDSVGVRGFPTLKYGDPNNLEDYKGGRDYAALKKFAEENLGPSCGPANLDLCDEAKKAQIAGFSALAPADLSKQIQESEDEMKKADSDMEAFVKGLQATYEAAQKTNEETKEKIKNSGLGLMKSVAAHRKSSGKEEL